MIVHTTARILAVCDERRACLTVFPLLSYTISVTAGVYWDGVWRPRRGSLPRFVARMSRGDAAIPRIGDVPDVRRARTANAANEDGHDSIRR
jgi:hypothetical protein